MEILVPVLCFVSAALCYALLRLSAEENKRKRLETVVAMLRDRETLNEQQVVLYMEAKKFDWLSGDELPA